MNKIIIILVVVVILMGIAGYFFLIDKPNDSSNIELTEEIALSVLEIECSSERVPGLYGSCTIDIVKGRDKWIVTVIFDGLYDDSFKAGRIEVILAHEDGKWVVRGDIIKTQQCWPGRGHQDFSDELCI